VDRLKQVASDRLDPDAVDPRIQPHGRHRPARDIDGGDLGGPFERRHDTQHPAPSAEVEHAGARSKALLLQVLREQPRITGRSKHARKGQQSHRPQLLS
jgi:hypothetical protein